MTDSPIPETPKPCTCPVPCTCGSQAATIASLKAALEEAERVSACNLAGWQDCAETASRHLREAEGERDAARDAIRYTLDTVPSSVEERSASITRAFRALQAALNGEGT